MQEKQGLLAKIIYAPLLKVFDLVEALIEGVRSGFSRTWNAFANGPLQHLLFGLILAFAGISLVIEFAAKEIDRLLAGLEKAVICVAMLGMVALCFLAYLQRSFPDTTLSMQGGPNMATLLMVWIGFLGASLATRQNKHLSVDATSRILTPKAARFTKRFIALVAAGFCWQFVQPSHAKDNMALSGSGMFVKRDT